MGKLVHYEKSLICGGGGGYLLLRTIISEDATSDLCVSIIFDVNSFLCLIARRVRYLSFSNQIYI